MPIFLTFLNTRLEFGRGAYNQVFARASSNLCTSLRGSEPVCASTYLYALKHTRLFPSARGSEPFFQPCTKTFSVSNLKRFRLVEAILSQRIIFIKANISTLTQILLPFCAQLDHLPCHCYTWLKVLITLFQ